MNEPKIPGDVRQRLFSLRCRSKRGEYLSPEDMAFLEECWKKYPTQYTAMGDDVFNATVPFGSHARKGPTP